MPDGACLCGRITYEIAGQPRFMYQCYCGKCRAASGASFVTNIIVDAYRFRITAGKDSLSAFESSPQKFRYFCAACGSPIYSHGETTKHIVSVRCGTLLRRFAVPVSGCKRAHAGSVPCARAAAFWSRSGSIPSKP